MKYTPLKSIDCGPNVEFKIKNNKILLFIAFGMFANWKVLFLIGFVIFYFLES